VKARNKNISNNNKKKNERIKRSLKEDIKIHSLGIQQIASDREHLEAYRYYLSLYFLTKNKSIRNYKSKFNFIRNKTGFSDYQIRKYTNALLKLGYVWWDKNTTSLNIKSKYYIAEKLGIIENNGDARQAFIRVHSEQINSSNKLKTIVLNLAANKKKFASGKSLLDSKNIDIENKRKSQRALIVETIRESMVNSEINYNLYLNEIKNLFGLKTNQGASKLLERLKKEKLIKVNKNYKELYSHNEFINLNNNNNNSLKFQRWNNSVFEQLPNQIIFNMTFPIKNKLVKIMNEIDENIKPVKLKKKPTHIINFTNNCKNPKYFDLVDKLISIAKNNYEINLFNKIKLIEENNLELSLDERASLQTKKELEKIFVQSCGIDESLYDNIFELHKIITDKIKYLLKINLSKKGFKNKFNLPFNKTFYNYFKNKFDYAKDINNINLLKRYNRIFNFWCSKMYWVKKEYTLSKIELELALRMDSQWLIDRTKKSNVTEVYSPIYRFVRKECKYEKDI